MSRAYQVTVRYYEHGEIKEQAGRTYIGTFALSDALKTAQRCMLKHADNLHSIEIRNVYSGSVWVR